MMNTADVIGCDSGPPTIADVWILQAVAQTTARWFPGVQLKASKKSLFSIQRKLNTLVRSKFILFDIRRLGTSS